MQRRLTLEYLDLQSPTDLHAPSSPCRPVVSWLSTLAFNYRRSGPLTWFFRIWFLRPACGTAVKSVRISISVCVCVSVWGELWARETLECGVSAMKSGEGSAEMTPQISYLYVLVGFILAGLG